MMFFSLFVTVSKKNNNLNLFWILQHLIFTILEKQKMPGISLVITLSEAKQNIIFYKWGLPKLYLFGL